MRQKLVELLMGCDDICHPRECKTCNANGRCFNYRAADSLIAKGLTIPVLCNECQYREDSEVRDRIWCRKLGRYMKEDGFCSLGERKDNG